MPGTFNREQEEAITHKGGPLMVLAGPGSGKTLVITYRVKWLIENAGAVGRTRATRGISATTTKNGACRYTTTAGCTLSISKNCGTLEKVYPAILEELYTTRSLE